MSRYVWVVILLTIATLAAVLTMRPGKPGCSSGPCRFFDGKTPQGLPGRCGPQPDGSQCACFLVRADSMDGGQHTVGQGQPQGACNVRGN